MGATRAQELCDLLLIACAVELRLHRIRRGRHLAERQRRGEDLDQERFHRTVSGLEQRREATPGCKSALQNGFLACPVPSRDKFPQCCKRAASSRPGRADIESTYSLISAHHPVEIIPKLISLARPSPRPRRPSRRRAGRGRKPKDRGRPRAAPMRMTESRGAPTPLPAIAPAAPPPRQPPWRPLPSRAPRG